MSPRDAALGLLAAGGVALLILALLLGIIGRRIGKATWPVIGFILAAIGVFVLALAAVARVVFAMP